MLKRSHQKLTEWLTVAAILWSALVPSVSHDVSFIGNSTDPWQQICTTQGAKSLRAINSHDSSDQGSTTLPDAPCSYCLLGIAFWAPPPSKLPPAVGTGVRHFEPILVNVFHGDRPAWTSPHSRAPPQIS